MDWGGDGEWLIRLVVGGWDWSVYMGSMLFEVECDLWSAGGKYYSRIKGKCSSIE